MSDEQITWRAGLNSLVVKPGASSFVFPPFGIWVRMVSLSVISDGAGADTAVVQWSVGCLDNAIACTVSQAQTLPGATHMTPWGALLASFLVNQQPSAAFGADGDPTAFAPGFLPPDLWLTPTDKVTIRSLYDGGANSISQAILRFYVPPQ